MFIFSVRCISPSLPAVLCHSNYCCAAFWICVTFQLCVAGLSSFHLWLFSIRLNSTIFFWCVWLHAHTIRLFIFRWYFFFYSSVCFYLFLQIDRWWRFEFDAFGVITIVFFFFFILYIRFDEIIKMLSPYVCGFNTITARTIKILCH